MLDMSEIYISFYSEAIPGATAAPLVVGTHKDVMKRTRGTPDGVLPVLGRVPNPVVAVPDPEQGGSFHGQKSQETDVKILISDKVSYLRCRRLKLFRALGR